MAVKGVLLENVPFYRQVGVSATSKMTTLDGGEVDLSKGDIVAVVGFRPQQKQCEGETRSAAQMRVVVFSGETREKVMECLVPVGAIVPGEMLCEKRDPIVEDKLFFRRRRKMDGDGTDGKYILPGEVKKSVITGLG